MFDDNKTICRRLLVEAWGEGILETVSETVSKDCLLHDAAFPTLGRGADSYERHIRANREAFPDFRFTCDDIIAERDEVVIHWTCHGTHSGNFLNFPATNRRVMISGTTIHRLERGKIVELWADWNLQSLLDQLGLGLTEQEANKAIVKRYVEEIWNRRRPEKIAAFVTKNYVRHSPSGPMRGAQGLRQDYDTYLLAFLDCHIRIDDMTCEGNHVVVRFTATGTHEGEFLDLPATNRTVSVPGITVIRIVGGKIAEEHVVWDRLGILQQLGATIETLRTTMK
jgi:steroid delta-isomerase-like uncharacterized protein